MSIRVIPNAEAAAQIPNGWKLYRVNRREKGYVTDAHPAVPGDVVIEVSLGPDEIEAAVAAGQAPWWPSHMSDPIPSFRIGDHVTFTDGFPDPDPEWVQGRVLGFDVNGAIIGYWFNRADGTLPDTSGPYESVASGVPAPLMSLGWPPATEQPAAPADDEQPAVEG